MENSKFTSETVDKNAENLLIGLTREENKMILDEFDQIDKDFSVLEKIEGLDKVEPMSWCLDRTVDSLQEDEVEESLPVDISLRNSGRTNDREIEVPRVVA